jgi:hypothetical protein
MYYKKLEHYNSIATKIDDILKYFNIIELNDTTYYKNLIIFMKEIFINKEISFTSIDVPKNNPIITGKCINIKTFNYKYNYFFKFKIGTIWYLVDANKDIIVKNYDANNKKYHKEVELKKEMIKYNL